MCNDIERNELGLDRKAARMGMLINRFYHASSPRFGAAGNPLRGQGRVLALLAAKPQTTQRELSYVLDMRQQSLSELLAKLEEKGYITRERSAEDGRVIVVSLTEKGAEAAPVLDGSRERPDALEVLSAEEREQLEALVDKVSASLSEKLQEMGVDLERPHHRGPHGHRGPGGPNGFPDPEGPCGPRGPRGPEGPCGPGAYGHRGGAGFEHHGMRQA